MLGIAIRVLEGMFLLGAVGSVLVLILTTIDDAKVLFSSDDKKEEGVRKGTGTLRSVASTVGSN